VKQQRITETIVLLRNRRNRRAVYGLLALISAVLIFFPQPYLSRAKIVPQDTSATAASTTTLLGALGSGNQGIGSLLTGGRPPSDLYLIIGRSDSVAQDVIKSLNWVGPGRRFASYRQAKLFLDRHVDVHLLLGGVMEIETKLRDPDDALTITKAYSAALSRQLATFGRQIIQNKQRIVQDRFKDAANRVSRAEVQLDAFRRQHNLAEPEQQLSTELVQRATLDAELKAKEVQLQTLNQFRGPDSNEIASLQSDIAGLRAQIAKTTTPATSPAGPNVAGLTAVSLQYLELFRNLKFQQSIYDIYQRSAEQVEVEELASESASYIQVIDPAYIDPHRQVNVWAIALFACVILAALFTEWYAPATGLFTLDREEDLRRVSEFAE
jgi:hypothetical protein